MKRQIISRKKAASLLSVSIKTIDRMIRNNRLEAFKPSGSSRVLIYADTLSQENLQSPKPKFHNNF